MNFKNKITSFNNRTYNNIIPFFKKRISRSWNIQSLSLVSMKKQCYSTLPVVDIEGLLIGDLYSKQIVAKSVRSVFDLFLIDV